MANVQKAPSLERPSIVTTKKEKDPRRVEAGKRLAAISKQAKERKKKEREASLGSPRVEGLAPPGGLMLALTTAGVVVALATLWCTRKDYQLSTKESEGAVDGEGTPCRRGEEPPSHRGLDSLHRVG